LVLVLAGIGVLRLLAARRLAMASTEPEAALAEKPEPARGSGGSLLGGVGRVELRDLAALSFVASLAFMALEMVAGRMVQRHLGSSVYGWTSVIGVLLGGLSLGNYLGGKVADHVQSEKQASWLFMVASMFCLLVLVLETP